jgi:hypothetical protein
MRGRGTYNEVKNISMNNPWTVVVPAPRVVRTLRVPGVIAWIIAAPWIRKVISGVRNLVQGRLTVMPPRI